VPKQYIETENREAMPEPVSTWPILPRWFSNQRLTDSLIAQPISIFCNVALGLGGQGLSNFSALVVSNVGSWKRGRPRDSSYWMYLPTSALPVPLQAVGP
jgi:hypothetical protein